MKRGEILQQVVYLALPLCLFFMFSCASTPEVKKEAPSSPEIEGKSSLALEPEGEFEDLIGYQTKPETIPLAETELEPTEGEEISFPEEIECLKSEEKFSIKVQNASLSNLIYSLTKDRGCNIIYDPVLLKEPRKVSVELTNLTLMEAFDSLLKYWGYTYWQDGKFLRIGKFQRVSRSFPFNFSVLTTFSGDKPETRTDDLVGGLEALLSERGEYVLNKDAGTITVTDFPEQVKRAGQYLYGFKGTAYRQVMIEAKVVEVTLDNDISAGVNWYTPPSPSNSSQWPDSALSFLGGWSNLQGYAFQNIPFTTEGFQLGISNTHISVLMGAISTKGDFSILSSPKIVTMNNRPASIDVKERVPYYDVRTSYTGQIIVQDVRTSFKTAGIKLDVTPVIDDAGFITMRINPQIDMITRYTPALGDRGPEPIVDSRRMTSTVRVKDGQTVVIGGILQDRYIQTESSVPWLSDIPIIGWLFGNRMQVKQKTELIIMISPHIILYEED